MNIVNLITSIIAPPYCAFCKIYLSERKALCSTCHSQAVAILPITLKLTTQYTLTIYARSDYKDPLRSLILAKGNAYYLAGKQLAEVMFDLPFLKNTIDYFIPVPLHWTRYASRGYNQAEVIAQTLGQKLTIPVISVVKRIQRTHQQSQCNSAQERANNVAKAFSLTSHYPVIRDKHIVLVDDLMTTGATLTAVAKTLIPLKPSRISAIVACRVCM